MTEKSLNLIVEPLTFPWLFSEVPITNQVSQADIDNSLERNHDSGY